MRYFLRYIFLFAFCIAVQGMSNSVSAQVMEGSILPYEGTGISAGLPDCRQGCDAAMDAARRKVGAGNILMWTGGGLFVAGATLYGLDVATLDNTWKGISGLAAAGTGIIALGTGVILHCVGKRQLRQIKCNDLTLALLPSDNGVGFKIRF